MTRTPTTLLALAALSAALVARPVRAEDPAPPCHDPAPAAGAPTDARVEVPDVELVDQDGKPVRLRALLSGNKAVIADFIFTTCTTVCPMLSGIVSRIQDRLGGRVGKDVVIVSITVDPDRDTPARLKAYAKRWKAGPGWVWLTGPKDVVDRVLKGMGAYTPNFNDHPAMVLVGDGRTGAWTRFNGFPEQELILARVGEITAARAAAPAATGAAR